MPYRELIPSVALWLTLITLSSVAPLNGQNLCHDTETSQSLDEVGSYRIEPAYDLQVSGSYAYVSGNDGVTILDIRDLRHPKRAGHIKTNTPAFGIHVVRETAFVATQGDGLVIADLRDRSEPTILGRYDGIEGGNSVLASGSHAYVTQDRGGLAVIRIDDPSNPTRVGVFAHAGAGKGLQLHRKTLYVVVRGRGLYIVDVADPTSPV
jgi:hypothetical protein